MTRVSLRHSLSSASSFTLFVAVDETSMDLESDGSGRLKYAQGMISFAFRNQRARRPDIEGDSKSRRSSKKSFQVRNRFIRDWNIPASILFYVSIKASTRAWVVIVMNER